MKTTARSLEEAKRNTRNNIQFSEYNFINSRTTFDDHYRIFTELSDITICSNIFHHTTVKLFQLFEFLHAVQDNSLVSFLNFPSKNKFVKDTVHFVKVKNNIQLLKKKRIYE